MKKAISLLLLIILCLSACAKAPEVIQLPGVVSGNSTSVGVPAADREPYMPGVAVMELRRTATLAGTAFDKGIFITGCDEGLVSGLYKPAIFTPYKGETYLLRYYPQNLSIPVAEYTQKPEENPQIEVYDTQNGDAPKRVVTLQGLAGRHVAAFAGGLTVDAEGIHLLLTTMDYAEDGTPDNDSAACGLYHFDTDGKLLSAVPFTMPMNDSMQAAFRAGGETYAFVRDIMGPEQYDDFTSVEKALFELQRVHLSRLCRLDAAEEAFVTVEREGYENTALLGAMAYPDGRVLCVDFVFTQLSTMASPAISISLFNPADGTSEVLSYVYCKSNDYFEPQMTYDTSTDTLFFIQNKELYAWRIGSAAPLARLMDYEPMGYFDMRAADGNLMFINKTGQIERLSGIILPDVVPLTSDNESKIAYGQRPNSTITALFNEYDCWINDMHHDLGDATFEFTLLQNYLETIRIEQIKYGYPYDRYADMFENMTEYYRILTKKLLSGDDDFDIFVIGGRFVGYMPEYIYNIAESGYCVTMEELGLAPLFDDMLPGIKEICSANGEIVFAPVRVELAGMMVSKPIMNILGLTPEDIPRDSDEFIAFVEKHYDAVTNAGYSMFGDFTLTMDVATLSQYGTAFFEKDEHAQDIWDALIRLNECAKKYSSDITSFNYRNPNVMFSFQAAGWQFNEMVFGGRLDSDFYNLPVPLLTEYAKYPLATPVFIGVNPRSKNLDVVKEYLSALLSESFHEYMITESQRLNATDANPRKYKHIQMCLYDVPGVDDTVFPSFSRYKEMLTNASRWYPGHYDLMNVPFHRSEITAEEWKTIVDRELEFMRDE